QRLIRAADQQSLRPQCLRDDCESRGLMPGVYFAKLSEEQAIARLRKINSWTGEKAAIQGSDNGHQNDDRNYRASRMSHDALGYARSHMFAGRDLRNGKHAHIGN